ncbi:MAG TPA: YhdH/YhfP family quinone oxidoreductase [Burkholderiaceae bacterium]|jgi:acrylyl-CoA reductase (NADPH)|nr:YhdH/YhfP family quinone oxidoreductase [Burkholderiaceae bacterium]
MSATQRAYRLSEQDGRVAGGVVEIPVPQIGAGDVLIRCEYAGVNYKDAMVGRGLGKIVRQYPRIGGIESVGRIERSNDPRFTPGDAVIVHGFGIGVDRDGGFAQYLSVPADLVLKLPPQLEPRVAATIGVAGYTAALSIDAMELNGLTPERGPIAVNGATGGVASVAIAMLCRRGYRVHALTRNSGEAPYLRALGAAEVLPPLEPSARPLESERWAGAVDSLGGAPLASLLRTMKSDGVIASFGNAAGNDLQTTVLPFILRGVRLIGIVANSPMPLRQRIWQRIATDLKPAEVDSIAQWITLDALPQAFDSLLQGSGRGRFVLRL